MKEAILVGLVSFCSSWALTFGQSLIDVTDSVGIACTYGLGNSGAGASFVDINGDGLDDLSLPTQAGDSAVIYINQGTTFLQIPSPIDDLGEQKQLLWADLDNDGDKDLYVPVHNGQDRLYENIGGLNMLDRTFSAGIVLESAPTFGATTADYDLDGDLDIYVSNYTESGVPDRLYRNNGEFSFTEVTASSGLTTSANFSFQASFIDYNNDGLPDIYVAVDKPVFNNLLYRNNGNGTFTDVSVSSGTDITIDAMNSGFGDIDNDGDLDIYVTNGPIGNVMLVNNGDGTFSQPVGACGTVFNMNSWGGNFFDADNDGLLDLFVNSDHFPPVNQALFMNQGGCNFIKYVGPFSGDGAWSYGSAIGDYNNDGQMDIIVNHAINTPYMLLENQSADSTKHWIKVRLEGTVSNRDAVGTWIEVYVDSNTYYHYTSCGQAYLAQNTNNFHFGLDTASSVDSIILTWPSGFSETVYNLNADQTVQITESVDIWQGTVDTDWNVPGNWLSGAVPTVSSNVLIPPGMTNYPVLDGGAFGIGVPAAGLVYDCKAMLIRDGAQLTVSSGSTLSNAGLIRVAGTLIMSGVPTAGVTNLGEGELRIIGNGQVNILD